MLGQQQISVLGKQMHAGQVKAKDQLPCEFQEASTKSW